MRRCGNVPCCFRHELHFNWNGISTPVFQSITITSTRWQRQRSDVISGPRGRNCCFYVMIRFYMYTFIRHIGILHSALNRTVTLRHEQPITIENTCMTNKVNTTVRVGRLLLAEPVGSEPCVFLWRPFPDGMGVVFWLETWKYNIYWIIINLLTSKTKSSCFIVVWDKWLELTFIFTLPYIVILNIIILVKWGRFMGLCHSLKKVSI